MSYVYYLYLGLVPSHNPASLHDLKSKLAARYAQWKLPHTIEVVDTQLTLTINDYAFTVHHVNAPHVLEESGDIARKYAKDNPQQAAMAACATRFEMYGDDDPNMDYFNDSLILQACIAELGDVFVFDPYGGKFMNV